MQRIAKERVLGAVFAFLLMAVALTPSTHHRSVRADVLPTGTAHVDVTFAAYHRTLETARPARPAGIATTKTESRTALIVAVAHSPGKHTIPGAIDDANNVRTALVGYGFPAQNIEMLIDAQATHRAILGGLRALAARTAPSGIAVFAIAGHSTSRSFAAGDGTRVSKYEIASRLGAIRGRVWSLFALCYAGAYAIPGTIGPGRVATFSSDANNVTWDSPVGSAFVQLMVVDAMTDRAAASSVESAFDYARSRLSGTEMMNDQVRGDLVLSATRAPTPTTAPGAGSDPPAPSPSPARHRTIGLPL